MDPYTGEKLGARKWGEVSLAKEHFLPFLYRLHYSLALPETTGNLGGYILGITALLWSLDCFVGFYLTLPVRRYPHPNPPPLAQGRELDLTPSLAQGKELPFLLPCSRSLRTGEAGWGPSPRSRLLRTGESGSGGRPFWQRWRLAW
ncbi:MAG: PepSY domain-containing protein, partial [Gammaproteobacteria bacterium]